MIRYLANTVSLPLVAGALSLLGLILYRLQVSFPGAPGARIARFTRLWYFYQVWRGCFEKTNIQLHKKYGKIVRLGPRDYSIDDPEAAKVIYGHGTLFQKTDWYSAWSPPQLAHLNLFTLSRIKAHAAERRKLASMYSMSTLLSYERYVDNCVAKLCQRFDEFSSTRETVDMAHYNQCFAFDVIGEITLGKRFGFLDAGQDIGGIINGLESFIDRCTLCGIYLWLGPIFFGGLLDNGARYVVDFVHEVMRTRPATQGEEQARTANDFLTKLNTLHAKDPENYTKLHIFSGCSTNIIAGSDTTSITLNSILYHMFKQPRVFTKLRSEIDDIYSHSGATPNEPLTFEQVQKMPYLQATIKEGLRIHPATGLPLWRVVPPGGVEIAGKYFPAGVNVGINSWVAHYNTSIFGDDADQFRPERWLDSSPEQLATMERYFMPFGLGSRTCIGKNISLLEISKVVPELVRRYDFQLAKDKWTSYNRWFVKQKDFEVWISQRTGKLSG